MARGISLAFVKEVNARVQALHEYSDTHGITLPVDLLDGVQQLNRHYRRMNSGDPQSFSANVSSVSDKSGHSKSPPIQFDLKEFIDDGSPHAHDTSLERALGLQEEAEDDVSLSFASSAYSTDSKRSEARRLQKVRKQELKEIRKSTKTLQQQVQARVRDLRSETSQAAEAECRVSSELTYYQTELERMKEAISKMLLETSKTKPGIRDSAIGSDHSSVLASRRPKFDSLDVDPHMRIGSITLSDQLREMQRELLDLHARIRSSEVSMRVKEQDNFDLKQQVGKLEESLVALGGDRVVLDKDAKSEACSDGCLML